MEPAAPVCGARPGVVHQGCDGAGDGSRTGSESGLQTRILVGERRQGRTAGLLRRRGRSGHRIVGHAGYAFGRRRHPFGHRRFRRRARQHRGKGVTASVPGRRTERGAHARRRPAPLVRRGVRRRRRSRQGGPRHGPDRRSEQGGIQPAADARARRPGHPAGRNRRCAADPCGRRVQRSPPGQTMALHQHRRQVDLFEDQGGSRCQLRRGLEALHGRPARYRRGRGQLRAVGPSRPGRQHVDQHRRAERLGRP